MAGGDQRSSSDESDLDESPAYPQMNPDLSMPGSEKPMINVLVTGFGLFRSYKVNASWEAVKELRKAGVAHNVNLIALEIPVEYETVKELIPKLWEKYKPQLVVHVGVSSIAEEITFESSARNYGYCNADNTGNAAPSECFVKNGIDCIQTGLDVDKLRADVNSSCCLAMAATSTDAGQYLCEYIFYASLCQDASRVCFIHVPDVDCPYSAIELGDGLRCAIQAMLKQMNLYHPLPLPDNVHSLELAATG